MKYDSWRSRKTGVTKAGTVYWWQVQENGPALLKEARKRFKWNVCTLIFYGMEQTAVKALFTEDQTRY